MKFKVSVYPALENIPCQWMYCFLFSLDLDRDSQLLEHSFLRF